MPEPFVTTLSIISGLCALLIGGDVLVRGAIALAQRLGVAPVVIGLTVVAFGTSAPELVVCLDAALTGVEDVALGNVVGSNIANILLVVGLPALLAPLGRCAEDTRRDGVVMLAVTVGFIGLCWGGVITIWHGLIMLVVLAAFLFWSYLRSRSPTAAADNGSDTRANREISKSAAGTRRIPVALGFILFGLVAVVGGAHLLIAGAVAAAESLGIPDAVIGLTLVALGTSLPELATALIAALRKHGDVALGNIIGSNIFNLLGIMGTTAVVTPIPVAGHFLAFDLWVMLAAAIALMPIIFLGLPLGRMVGLIFTCGYAIYIWALFRGMSALSMPV